MAFYLDLSSDKVESFIEKLDEELDENIGPASSVIKGILQVQHVRLGLILGILALQITTSIWPIVFFSTEFLRRANVEVVLAERISSLMLILSTIATFLGLLSIEKFQRRKLFISASAVNILSLLFFVVFSQVQRVFDVVKYGCVIAICCQGISYSFATGPIAWFITAELVPTEYRSACQSIALGLNHLVAFALTLFVLPLYDLIDSYALIILFIIPTTISLFVIYKLLPETKGRDIQEVIGDLRAGTVTNDRVENTEMRN